MSGARTVDQAAFRRTMGLFATGVTVVTTAVDGPDGPDGPAGGDGRILHGMTANAFASVSLDPPLVLVCVARVAGLHDLLPRSGAFTATILADDQEAASTWFASPRRPEGTGQFDGWDHRPAPVTGCPVLAGGLAYVDCRVTAVLDGGDHSIFLGEVVAIGDPGETGDRPSTTPPRGPSGDDPSLEPLVWYRGGYRRLAPGPAGP